MISRSLAWSAACFAAVALSVLVGSSAAAASSMATFRHGVDGYAGASNGSFDFDGTNASVQIRIDLPDLGQPAGSYAHLLFSDIIGATAIPAGSTIESATLEGWVTNGFESASVARLLMDISGRSMSPDRIDDAGVAGSFYDNTTAVSASHGACCDPAPLISWDVMALVQAWADGETNHGFLVLPDTTNGGNLAPVEAADPALRPRLSVVYLPEPATLTLFGVGLVGLALLAWRRAAG